MKVLIQIVQKAKVMVSNQLVSNIHQGYVLFVGIEKEDTIETVQKMAQKSLIYVLMLTKAEKRIYLF